MHLFGWILHYHIYPIWWSWQQVSHDHTRVYSAGTEPLSDFCFNSHDENTKPNNHQTTSPYKNHKYKRATTTGSHIVAVN
jgi:hypothetical protein